MAALPNELLDSIFSYLPHQGLCAVTKTCRSFAWAGNRALYTNVSVNTADRDGVNLTRLFALVRTILTDQTLANHVQSAELLGLEWSQDDSTLEVPDKKEEAADRIAQSLNRFPSKDFLLLEQSLFSLGDHAGFERISSSQKWSGIRDCLYALFLSRMPKLRRLIVEFEPCGLNSSLCFAVDAALKRSDACPQRFEHLEELEIRACIDLRGMGKEVAIPFYSIPSLRRFRTNLCLPVSPISKPISNIEILVFNGWSHRRSTGTVHAIKACKALKSFTFENWTHNGLKLNPTPVKTALDRFKATITSVTLLVMPQVLSCHYSTEDGNGGWFRDYQQLTHLSISYILLLESMVQGWPLPSLLPASLEYLELEGIDIWNLPFLVHGLEQLATAAQRFPNLRVFEVSMSENTFEECEGLVETCAKIFEHLNIKVDSQTFSFGAESEPETNIFSDSGPEEWHAEETADEWEN